MFVEVFGCSRESQPVLAWFEDERSRRRVAEDQLTRCVVAEDYGRVYSLVALRDPCRIYDENVSFSQLLADV